MKHALKEGFSTFCRNTSFHGFKELHEAPSKCQQFVWLLLIVGSTGMLGYFAKVQCSKLFDGQSISTRINRLNTSESKLFSPIWFLYYKFSWIDYDKVRALDLTPEELKFSLSFLSAEFEYNDTIVSLEEASRSLEVKINAAGICDIKSFYDFISLNIHDHSTSQDLMLEKSFFDNMSPAIIRRPNIIKDGFTETYKLYLLLNMSDYEENFGRVQAFLHGHEVNNTRYQVGPRLELVNIETKSFLVLQANQAHVVNTDMDIYQSIRNCRTAAPGYVYYTPRPCERDCELIADNYSSRENTLLVQMTPTYRSGKVPLCSFGIKNTRTGAIDGKGFSNAQPKVGVKSASFDQRACNDACLPSCDQRKTIWVTSTGPSDDQNKNLASVYFTIPATLVMIEEVHQYEWHDLISDFGGLMGLWLGASMMSLVQVVHLCFAKGRT